jgi:hypothetical protein
MTGTCDAQWETFGILTVCGQPAEGIWRRACVHEHVRDGLLCAEHASLTDTAFCKTCHELDGHGCPLGLKRVGEVGAEVASC